MRRMRRSKDGERMYAVIASMAVGNPQYRCPQDETLAIVSKCPKLQTVKPVLKRIYGNSHIGNRYFCVPDFNLNKADDDPLFYPRDGSYQVKSIESEEKYSDGIFR